MTHKLIGSAARCDQDLLVRIKNSHCSFHA